MVKTLGLYQHRDLKSADRIFTSAGKIAQSSSLRWILYEAFVQKRAMTDKMAKNGKITQSAIVQAVRGEYPGGGGRPSRASEPSIFGE